MRKRKGRISVWMYSSVLVIALLIAGGGLVGCGDRTESPVQSLSPLQKFEHESDVDRVNAIMDVQNRSTEALFSNAAVVGTGTGRDADGNFAIVVYTRHEVAQRGRADLSELESARALDAIPVSIGDIPVVAKVTGDFRVYADPTARFPRPVPIGVSTGHPDITAGTIGCRVKNSGGSVFALSNNHIYANSNNATIGDNVLQPGPTDGGSDPADAIGTLYDFEPIKFDGSNNTIDAAIALTSTGNVGTATPSGDGYGAPSATIVSAFVGQNVQKYGRTTGWTHGQVAEINVTVDVCYAGFIFCTSLARFVNQIGITPGDFSSGGDSGSLIVTDDANRNPVGLLFAGSSERTLANPIGAVLSRFSVTVDDGSGGTTNNPPTANFSVSTNELTASFTDLSTDSDGSVVAWSWNFGDGNSSTAQNPSHTYAAAGTYMVSLTVTDDDGATGSASQNVSVSSGDPTNNPPTADFSFTTSGLTASFTDLSTDSDGNVVGWSWNFGDGNTSTAQNPSHTYAASGTYTVSLTVTDDDGATGSTSQSVSVTSSSGGITLSVVGYKVRGRKHADLTWSGATGTSVEIYRDNVLIVTTANDGFHTDATTQVGGGSFTYRVCEVGGSPCSNNATVTY